MAKAKEITVSVGLTKALATQYEFIRIDIGGTFTLCPEESEADAYKSAFEKVEAELMVKLAELYGNQEVNKQVR